MSKFVHNPTTAISQMLAGVAYTYQNQLRWIANTGIILQKEKPNQVALISGGGSGHEPAHIGYVGDGLLQASVSGPFFTPPPSEEIFQAIQESDIGKGVLLIVKNFEADVANFQKAKEMAISAGHQVEMVIVNDDCSIESDTFKKRRRGVAGTVFVHKLLGAAAREGYDLKQLVRLSEQIIPQLNTLGVAFSPSTNLIDQTTQYQLQNDEIYFGIGIHGEPGYRVEKFQSSERLAIELVNKLKNRYRKQQEYPFAILVNGLGSTPLMELFIFMNDVQKLLHLDDFRIDYHKVGNHLTSFDTRGISLTLLPLLDHQWQSWLEQPVGGFGW